MMDVIYALPDFARVISQNIYNLETETDLTIVTRDGVVQTHKLALFFVFPSLKYLTR